jgi:hypothetical protein
MEIDNHKCGSGLHVKIKYIGTAGTTAFEKHLSIQQRIKRSYYKTPYNSRSNLENAGLNVSTLAQLEGY